MIQNNDRSGWFGASDTARVMGSWKTKTFAEWWSVKCGFVKKDFCTKQMQAGTYFEHKILDRVGVTRKDRQIKIPSLLLRVNLDGETKYRIYECKTYGGEFKVSSSYWMQCQVEMFASKKPCTLVAYRLLDADYANYFNDIDSVRLSYHPIEYDETWIKEKYLPRLKELARALRNGDLPNESANA